MAKLCNTGTARLCLAVGPPSAVRPRVARWDSRLRRQDLFSRAAHPRAGPTASGPTAQVVPPQSGPNAAVRVVVLPHDGKNRMVYSERCLPSRELVC
jgi:hypothetical protein